MLEYMPDSLKGIPQNGDNAKVKIHVMRGSTPLGRQPCPLSRDRYHCQLGYYLSIAYSSIDHIDHHARPGIRSNDDQQTTSINGQSSGLTTLSDQAIRNRIRQGGRSADLA
jgi:hypothetical protein